MPLFHFPIIWHLLFCWILLHIQIKAMPERKNNPRPFDLNELPPTEEELKQNAMDSEYSDQRDGAKDSDQREVESECSDQHMNGEDSSEYTDQNREGKDVTITAESEISEISQNQIGKLPIDATNTKTIEMSLNIKFSIHKINGNFFYQLERGKKN